MLTQCYRAALALLVLSATVMADTVIVDEDFESYANDAALYSVWEPKTGDGFDDVAGGAGVLTTDTVMYPGIDGTQAVSHSGGSVLQFLPATIDDQPQPDQLEDLLPSATQNLVLQADIYHDGTRNKRMTVGLRNRDPIDNIFEMGFYNTSLDFDYGYRALFFTGDNPNWAYFDNLPIELDRPSTSPDGDYNGNGIVDAADYTVWRDTLGSITEIDADGDFSGEVDAADYDLWKSNFGNEGVGDGIITVADVGPGWHRFKATISEFTITLELDLFRDGMNNGTNTPGVDSTIVLNLETGFPGFDSLRIGGPSGVSSAGGSAAFDNIYLALVDIPLNSVGGLAAVPEPTSSLLLLLGIAGLLFSTVTRMRNR